MGGTPVPYVAVFFSKHTRLHFGQNDPGERYLLNFLGACKVLLESHIPFDIVTDRGLTAKDLSRYRALVLPNAACLDDVQNEAVRNYVESGGGLVSTFMTSLFDSTGKIRSDFGLGQVLGAKFRDTVTLPLSYLKFDAETELARGLPPDVPLLHRAIQTRVRVCAEAVAQGRIVYGQHGLNRLSSPCHPPEMSASTYPAMVLNSPGKGRSVYFPGQPDGLYAKWGHPEYKVLLTNAVTWAAGQAAPLQVDAPMCVEATLLAQPEQGRVVVHLVNYQPELGRTFTLTREKFVA
jgi:hypothetical protein